MKRFSNLEYKEQLIQSQPSALARTIDHIISETLSVILHDELVTPVTIQGQEALRNAVLELLTSQKTEDGMLLNEALRFQLHNNVDQELLNQNLEQLYEMYSALQEAPSPEDIFCREDYNQQGDTFIIKSLSKIPQDFLDHINYQGASKYFEAGNTSRILYADNGWHLFFVPAAQKNYTEFIHENNEFIADFIKATERLIGNKNLKIDRALLNSLYGLD